jgi:hypothetical protein
MRQRAIARATELAELEAKVKDDKEKLTTRQRNNRQEKRGQAKFTVKDTRECPDIYRPSKGD